MIGLSIKHYIRVDARGVILYGFSSMFEQPLSTDICIRENGTTLFKLFDDGEENPFLCDYVTNVPKYKWAEDHVELRSVEEIQADVPPPVYMPSLEDRIAAIEALELERLGLL